MVTEYVIQEKCEYCDRIYEYVTKYPPKKDGEGGFCEYCRGDMVQISIKRVK